MTHYLRQRKSGGCFFQRRVPMDLRHRRDVFGKSQFIEEYLGTTDKTVAKRKVSAVNEKWEQIFEAMRKGEAITEARLDRIRLKAQLQAHKAMVADPLREPNKVADDLERFLPDGEAEARAELIAAGLDPNKRNLEAAESAIYLGRMEAQTLYRQGIEPAPVNDLHISGPTVLEAAKAYQEAPDVDTTEKTRRQLLSSARLFAEHVGKERPVAVITGRDAVAFLDRLAKIDPEYRRHKRAGEMTLAEIEAAYPATDSEGLSASTINRHAMHLRVLINWMIARHELPEEHRNPFDKKSRKVKADGYELATDDEIAALLDGTPLACSLGRNFSECIGWLVALGAFTGARAGELCGLTKDDVRKRDGIHFLAIRGGKTANARRAIPLHPELIQAGILEYANTCDGPLFGITAKTLAKRFPPFRRSRGVDRPGLVFHSLRKSFISALEEAEVSADTAALLAGHKSRRSFTFSLYSPHGPTLKTLSEAVARVRYKAVKLTKTESAG